MCIRDRVITKVLYPADDHMEGKTLRLKQQYFFVSATAQNIVRDHRRVWGDVRNFAEHHVIHINDTHPTLIIPELMRIFMDEDGLGWDEAWDIVSNCVAYTNHTIMSEALETWPQGLVQSLLPRVFEIISEINRRWRAFLGEKFNGDNAKISRNAVIAVSYTHLDVYKRQGVGRAAQQGIGLAHLDEHGAEVDVYKRQKLCRLSEKQKRRRSFDRRPCFALTCSGCTCLCCRRPSCPRPWRG